MTEPKLCTLDRVMAENRRLKAENELLMQGLQASIVKTEETLALARKLVAGLTQKETR